MGEACFHDECAVMAIALPPGTATAAQLCYDGLRQQQHRGQDGAGMVIRNDHRAILHKRRGLVSEVFNSHWVRHRADLAIGHNRYATHGTPSEANLQPHRAVCRGGRLFLASNGDITNFASLRRRLKGQGVAFRSNNDGELLAWLVAKAYDRTRSMPAALAALHGQVQGAYSAVLLFQDRVFVVRDPLGFRPLSLASIPGGGIAAASETVAFDILHADPGSYREVPAGAILELHRGRCAVHAPGGPMRAGCSFELIYFSRPDSLVFGLPDSLIRRRLGWNVARESRFRRKRGVIVTAVPDSSNEIAAGVAEELGLPFVRGLIRSHTARRTFIEKEQRIRDEGVKYKLNPNRYWLDGMTVLLVDDSIVRGTNIGKIVRMLKRIGAAETHILIGSPRIFWPCYMGIATPTREELIANRMSLRELADFADADSVFHLSLEGLRRALGPVTAEERRRHPGTLGLLYSAPRDSYRGRVLARLEDADPDRYCYACFSGRYPVPVPRPARRRPGPRKA
ncbi:MAG: amidophosphoribosyltransferase [Candidatus Eisenbacteria bacterium]|uniref:Amidophosphoribosyltransferase n=1 Tax=Eiseniibacteriota bacterium TaxID=2212470 RepID=A0A937X6V5_UNCEI|nr:amidophosphoribosyltransferase [Candidatus Eisenbacteria bacterium]